MTQIVQRTVPPADALGTLADNTSVVIETAYSNLDEPSFLFEYQGSGYLLNLDRADLTAAGGVTICLVRADISDSDLDTELTPFTMTKTTVGSGRYKEHQRVFAIATMRPVTLPSAGDPGIDLKWEISFKPRKKGGIPFNEGNGWKLVLINQTASALTTGALLKAVQVMQRFAFGGF